MKRVIQSLVLASLLVTSVGANTAQARLPILTSDTEAEIELAEARKEIKDLRKELRDESKAAADARREAEHYYNLVIKRFGA
ncbi:MAG: hypothetical protein UV38_C0005G0015 [candidate division TM6 bacterium GW2011_GWE2_42_60]|nr:MAG: hypothetical protein UV38_C0005G0015 [candidate division TM6 bacterium GW2011_GWE2_42_60]HBY05333.1 hypothetical protein [Candidatus Dependentiae bacterium]